MNKKELLLLLLKEAVGKCYLFDESLINRSMEQASVAKIFYYMQEALKYDNRFSAISHYNLDSEYNKNGEHIKHTPRCPNGTQPDIVLHKRWPHESQDNLLVVEFKACKGKRKKYIDINTHIKTNKPMDFVKLEDFTNYEIYNYQLGVFVKLNKRGAKYICFEDNQKQEEGYWKCPR